MKTVNDHAGLTDNERIEAAIRGREGDTVIIPQRRSDSFFRLPAPAASVALYNISGALAKPPRIMVYYAQFEMGK